MEQPNRYIAAADRLRSFAQDDNRPSRGIRLGQQGGEKRKTLRAKVLGGSQKIFWETRKAL